MGYSTGWRSQWRILKQCICIWQFFIVLLSSTGYAVCSPCVPSCLWVILTGRCTGAALWGSYLWKPNAISINHLLLHRHILYFHMIPGFYWPQGRPVHPSVFGEQSVYPCSPHPPTHPPTLCLSPLPPSSPSRVGRDIQVWKIRLPVSALPCLICGLQLPGSWHGQGDEVGIKPLAPLRVPYGLFFTTGCDFASL